MCAYIQGTSKDTRYTLANRHSAEITKKEIPGMFFLDYLTIRPPGAAQSFPTDSLALK